MRIGKHVTMICLSLGSWSIAQPVIAQSGQGPLDGPIVLFEERVTLPNGSATDHALLGDLYLRRARTTGDVGDLVAAEQVARESLALLPGYSLGTSILIRTLGEQHRFGEVRDLAAAQLERDPTDAVSALALGDALIELGEVERAEGVFLALGDQGPAVTARLAKIVHRRNPHKAIGLARQALDEARAVHAPDQDWYRVFLADMLFDEGHFDEAGALLSIVRAQSPEFPAGLSVTAELHSALGEDAEALHHLERLAELRPADPLVAVAVGDAYSRLGDSRRSREAYALAESLFLDAVGQIGGIYDRQLALLYADQERSLADALDLAYGELARRESPESLVAVGWVLYRQGRIDAATEFIERALQSGIRDLDIYFRASQVFRAAGLHEAADRYSGLAHSWSPHLFPKGDHGSH